MAIEFGEPLSVPFSEIGESVAITLPSSVVGINGRQYLLDTESGEWKRQGINVVEQRNTTSNRDLLLLPQGVWRQMFESWHQGAGQSNLDRDDALPYRFNESYGVNVWDKYHLSLLNDTERIYRLPRLADKVFLHVHNGHLAVCTGSQIHWFTDQNTSTGVPVGTSTIISTTYDGDFVWTLHEDGSIWKSDEANSTAVTITWPTGTTATDATFIAYVKDYLIVGVGNKLFDITDQTKPALVYTSPVVGFSWRAATDGDQAIYLIGGAGDKHVVHAVQVSDDGTKLMPASVAATLPDGEIGYSIGSYLGFIFIGTDRGVRMAGQQQNALLLGAMLPTTAPVLGFEGQDRFVWYTNSQVPSEFGLNQEGFPPGTVPGLSRIDLTTFTVTEATPAYASDIVAEQAVGTVRSVVTWNNVRVFSIDSVGVYMETPDRLMEKGWATHGTVSFGVEDSKTALYAQFKWLPLDGSVGMFAAYDSRRYTRLAENGVPQSIASGNITMDGQQFSRLNVGVILHRDPSNLEQGPVVTRWEFRAVPVKGIASRWYLPIINRSQIDINGATYNRNVREELDILMKLVQRGGMFPLHESGEVYFVTARDFEWRPETLAPDLSGWQGTYVLVVEEIA